MEELKWPFGRAAAHGNSERDISNPLENFRKTILDNGVEVFTLYDPSLPSTYGEVGRRTGGFHDPADARGVTHFEEHLWAHSHPDMTDKEFQSWQDSRGFDEVNLYTADTNVYAAAAGQTSSVAEYLQMAATIFTQGSFSDAMVEAERVPIFEEMNAKYYRRPQIEESRLLRNVYAESPCWEPRGGIPAHIERITPTQIRDNQKTHLLGGNLYVLSIGNIQHEDLVRFAVRNFADIPSGKTPSIPEPVFQPGVSLVPRPEEQGHVLSTVVMYPMRRPSQRLATQSVHACAVNIFSKFAHHHARLTERFNYGVHFSGSAAAAGTEWSEMRIGTEISARRSNEVFPALQRTLRRILTASDSELDEHLTNAKKQLVSQSDSMRNWPVEGLTDSIKRHARTGGALYTADERISGYQAVTVQDIREEAQKVFASRPHIAIFGHIPDDIYKLTPESFMRGYGVEPQAPARSNNAAPACRAG